MAGTVSVTNGSQKPMLVKVDADKSWWTNVEASAKVDVASKGAVEASGKGELDWHKITPMFTRMAPLSTMEFSYPTDRSAMGYVTVIAEDKGKQKISENHAVRPATIEGTGPLWIGKETPGGVIITPSNCLVQQRKPFVWQDGNILPRNCTVKICPWQDTSGKFYGTMVCQECRKKQCLCKGPKPAAKFEKAEAFDLSTLKTPRTPACVRA